MAAAAEHLVGEQLDDVPVGLAGGASHAELAGAVAARVGVGTEGEAVERLLGAVRAYLDEGPRARYAVADGCWQVDDDARPLIEVNGLAALASTAAAACGPALD